MQAHDPSRWRLSILQSMKVVAYAAVAFACVAPMVHLWQIGFVHGGTLPGLLGIIVFESVAVPLVWVLLSFILVRAGEGRDALVVGFLLLSVLTALGFACWTFLLYRIPAYLRSPYENVGISSVALHFLVIVALAAAATFLLFRLIDRIARLRSRPE